MMISTQHLLPNAMPTLVQYPEQPTVPAAAVAPPSVPETPAISDVAPPTQQEQVLSPPISTQGGGADAASFADAPTTTDAEAPASEAQDPSAPETKIEDSTPTIPVEPAPTSTPIPGVLTGEGTAEAPMEIVDEDGDTKPTPQQQPFQPPQPIQIYPGGFAIDVAFEASKLPLDVAIFNSARAAGGDEKIRKYLQAVLVIGGTALVPGMAHALESRLQAIATPLVPNMEKVQIIPPPKDVDPRALAWKGGAVLGKMDGVADLWITADDWDIFGIRGLKERCFYL